MRSLRDGNKVSAALIGLTLIVAAVLGAFFSDRLPIIGAGPRYTAEFTEAAGMKEGNEVRISGIRVGQVKAIELNGNKVEMSFTADGGELGDQTRASIEVKDLLGQKYLALEPAGSGELDPDTPIPVSRTRSPYDVAEALSGLSETVGEIDTPRLAESMRVLSDTFANSPQEIRGALKGLTRLSRTISSRDAQLKQLLGNTNEVTSVLADRRNAFSRLVSDGNLLLGELRKRRDAIDAFLTGTREMAHQFAGLVADNERQIGPALAQLNRITKILDRHRRDIDLGIERLAPTVRLGSNIIGSGRYFEAYFCNIIPPSAGPINPEGCTP